MFLRHSAPSSSGVKLVPTQWMVPVPPAHPRPSQSPHSIPAPAGPVDGQGGGLPQFCIPECHPEPGSSSRTARQPGPGCSPTGMLRACSPDSPPVAWTAEGQKEPAPSPRPGRNPGLPWACDVSSQARGARSTGRSGRFPVCAVSPGGWPPKALQQRASPAKSGGGAGRHPPVCGWS